MANVGKNLVSSFIVNHENSFCAITAISDILWEQVQTVFCQILRYPFNGQSHKMVKHTQTNRRQFADGLFEFV